MSLCQLAVSIFSTEVCYWCSIKWVYVLKNCTAQVTHCEAKHHICPSYKEPTYFSIKSPGILLSQVRRQHQNSEPHSFQLYLQPPFGNWVTDHGREGSPRPTHRPLWRWPQPSLYSPSSQMLYSCSLKIWGTWTSSHLAPLQASKKWGYLLTL